MHTYNFFRIPLIIILSCFFCFSLPAQQAADILEKTHKAIDNIKTLKYRSVMWERLKNGGENKSEARIKVQCEPYKLYFFNIYPKDGVEVLYDEKKEAVKALVNPNGFPWVNIKLNIHSDHMREGKHHSINRAGMSYFDQTIKIAEKATKSDGTFDEVFSYGGLTTIGEQSCHKLIIDNKSFKIEPYTVKDGESVVSIASKYFISEYKILELNPGVKGYFDLKTGQEIKIPSSYGKHIVLYVNPDTYIPQGIDIKDEKGLFEKYRFHDMEVNPAIKPVEFTENCTDYGF